MPRGGQRHSAHIIHHFAKPLIVCRTRVELLCRLLLETNQVVAQIALGLGYRGVEHIAHYFRRETGLTPLAYRKRYGRP